MPSGEISTGPPDVRMCPDVAVATRVVPGRGLDRDAGEHAAQSSASGGRNGRGGGTRRCGPAADGGPVFVAGSRGSAGRVPDPVPVVDRARPPGGTVAPVVDADVVVDVVVVVVVDVAADTDGLASPGPAAAVGVRDPAGVLQAAVSTRPAPATRAAATCRAPRGRRRPTGVRGMPLLMRSWRLPLDRPRSRGVAVCRPFFFGGSSRAESPPTL